MSEEESIKYPSIERIVNLSETESESVSRESISQAIASGSQLRPRTSSETSHRDKAPLGSGGSVNLSQRQATTLAMALSSAFTLMIIDKPTKNGPMPHTCGPNLYAKLQKVLESPQFAGSFRKVPSRPTCHALLKRLHEKGIAMRDGSSAGRKKKCRHAIEAILKLTDQISVRQVSLELRSQGEDVGHAAVARAARELDLSWQKQISAQYLSGANVAKRLDFARNMLQKIDTGVINIMNVAWTDESWIQATDGINRHNNGLWRLRGEHYVDRPGLPTSHKQHHTKVMMFCLIHPIAGVIGPEFLDDYTSASSKEGLDQKKYQKILERVIEELKRRLGEDFKTCWFQQDGAPAHTAGATIRYLKSVFNGRLIAKGTEFEWPPSSPDLNPLDYWFWALVSSKVGPRGHYDRDMLIATACLATKAVDHDKLAIARAVGNFRLRLMACIHAHGHHFEHYFKTMRDQLTAFAGTACDECGQVHDNCETCKMECLRVWLGRFDFNIPGFDQPTDFYEFDREDMLTLEFQDVEMEDEDEDEE